MSNTKIRILIYSLAFCIFWGFNNLVIAKETKTHTSQDTLFSVEIPKTWRHCTFSWYGEYTTMFISRKVSCDRIREKGFDGENVSIKVHTLNTEALKRPELDLFNDYKHHQIDGYKKMGINLIVSAPKKKELNYADGLIATHSQPGEKGSLFILKRQNKLIVLKSNYKLKYEKTASKTTRNILNSFKTNPPKKIKTKVFSSHNQILKIRLPESWFELNKPNQFFVSKEEISGEHSVYHTGVSMIKINNFSDWSSKDFENDDDIAKYWIRALLKHPSEHTFKLLHITPIELNNTSGSGYLLERSHYVGAANYYFQTYELVFAKNNSAYHITFEAPVHLFEKYRPVFDNAIQTLSLK